MVLMIKLFRSRVLNLVPDFGYGESTILDNVLSPNFTQCLSKTKQKSSKYRTKTIGDAQ